MVFDKDLLENGVVKLVDIIDKEKVKPVKYFLNLGIYTNSENLLIILDLNHALPEEWKTDSSVQLCEVDL